MAGQTNPTRKRSADGKQAPILFRDLRKMVRTRKALEPTPELALRFTIDVASSGKPEIELRAQELEQGPSGSAGVDGYRLELTVGAAAGAHVFPPSISCKKLPSTRKLKTARPDDEVLRGHLPGHLALRPLPEKLPAELRVRPRIDSDRYRLVKGGNQATTVFTPDDRATFNDTSFPWCTLGRVDTAGGLGSGVMIGPRHLLTVSHAIVWNRNGTAGWVKFTPSYFDGSAPFGAAWGERVYFESKVTPPDIDGEEAKHDYVVVVLDRRLGDTTGWMGSRPYDHDWDGGTYWSHVGYPTDLASGNRPCFQGDIALDGVGDELHEAIHHRGDVWPGQSGGPFFAWWEGEEWPRAVSVQSWQNTGTNGASGGSHLVDLVIRARSEFP